MFATPVCSWQRARPSLEEQTSNAVERSNRRFRKAQQSVYSVRTNEHLEQRLALARQREQHASKRHQSRKTLHPARSKADSLR